MGIRTRPPQKACIKTRDTSKYVFELQRYSSPQGVCIKTVRKFYFRCRPTYSSPQGARIKTARYCMSHRVLFNILKQLELTDIYSSPSMSKMVEKLRESLVIHLSQWVTPGCFAKFQHPSSVVCPLNCFYKTLRLFNIVYLVSRAKPMLH